MVDNVDKVQDSGADEDRPSVGGKKKLFLIIAVAAVLLLGGGLTAYLLSGDANEEVTETPVEEPEPQGEPVYHKLDPVFVVRLSPGGKAKMLQVGLQVFTHDPNLGAVLERHAPMLRHYLLDVLANQQADPLYTRAGRAALQTKLEDELRNRLASVGEEKPQIDGLYFTQFVLQ